MPGGMNGYELANQAMKKRPNLKVLLTSGFTKKREEINNGDKAVNAKLAANLLSKPYNKAELTVSVRHALDEESSPLQL